MMRLLLAILIALHASSAPAGVSAHWVTPDVARIEWSGAACLYKGATLIACYPRTASYMIELGSYPGLDAAFRPKPNDVFTIVRRDGTQERAVLGAKPVYFPLWR